MLSLEDNWASLSRAVQESTDGGVFPTDVLLRATNDPTNVADLKNASALMLFVCRRSPSYVPLLKNYVVPDINDYVVCQIPEITVRISDQNAYGFAPRNYMMIYDCRKVVSEAALWKIWANGTIINPKSGYALAASAGNSVSLPASKWNQGVVKQVLRKNRDSCVTCNDRAKGSVVEISSCSPASPGPRWVFESDGTFMNLNYGLVLEVKGSDPNLQQIIISPVKGAAKQKWLVLHDNYNVKK
eukprot:XP_015576303.1 beta-galactoside-specific lectin 3-like [Ricinus communis]